MMKIERALGPVMLGLAVHAYESSVVETFSLILTTKQLSVYLFDNMILSPNQSSPSGE